MGGGDSEENVLSACDRAATGLWRIERDERFGRYMVANRDILPGQLILAEEPIVWGPNTTNRNLVCLGCFRLILLEDFDDSDGKFEGCDLMPGEDHWLV